MKQRRAAGFTIPPLLKFSGCYCFFMEMAFFAFSAMTSGVSP
jgi:hypothetical protein